MTNRILFSALIFFCLSCSKSEGEGGTSSIRGKVYAKIYNKNITAVNAEGYAPEEDVYIIYGDQVTYSDNQNTNYDGYYEFKYLRPGNYKVYAYSRDSTGAYKYNVNTNAPAVAVIAEVKISTNYETVVVPDISIIK
ncbi:MAG: hypothetical protein ACKOXB_08950 [Flavobacteriales bacterium]